MHMNSKKRGIRETIAERKNKPAPPEGRGRNRPVERDEVVLGTDANCFSILAVPANACTRDEYGDPVVIAELVEPLIEELKREYSAFQDKMMDSNSVLNLTRGVGGMYDVVLARTLVEGAKKVYAPRLPYFLGGGFRKCRHCDGWFAHMPEASRLRYCSGACGAAGKAARQGEWVARRSVSRENHRAGGRCERCGVVLEAKRGAKRYCSGKCRVAAHRAGAGAGT
jgi:hypothetical protein